MQTAIRILCILDIIFHTLLVIYYLLLNVHNTYIYMSAVRSNIDIPPLTLFTDKRRTSESIYAQMSGMMQKMVASTILMCTRKEHCLIKVN